MSKITIHQNGQTDIRIFTPPARLSTLLREAELFFPCGGKGICGGCHVQAHGALSAPDSTETEKLSPALLQSGVRLACRAEALGDAEVTLPQTAAPVKVFGTVPRKKPLGSRYGFAVDLGTTTVAVALFSLADGQKCGETAFRNPQAKFGADVLSRMQQDKAVTQNCIRDALYDACLSLLQKCGLSPADADTAVLVGNTAMLYLLFGLDTACLRAAPFDCETLFGDFYSADFLPLRTGSTVYIPRCISAFLGADITAAAIASDLCKSGVRMLCDLGTNGEILLQKDGKLYGCSCAAGPAFEAVGITCGMPCTDGAVERVLLSGGLCIPSIHSGGTAKGICGTGLSDLIACLLRIGLLQADGTLSGERFTLPGTNVYVTQKDVRVFQLAKSAVRTGMELLLRETNTAAPDTLEIAGAFGSALQLRTAETVGLIPSGCKKTRSIGNAAANGAASLLLDESRIAESERLAQSAKTLPLAELADFNDTLLRNLAFQKVR